MTGHSVAFSVSVVRLGKREEAEVHRERKEEVLVRTRNGQDEVNFAREDNLSIKRQDRTERKWVIFIFLL